MTGFGGHPDFIPSILLRSFSGSLAYLANKAGSAMLK